MCKHVHRFLVERFSMRVEEFQVMSISLSLFFNGEEMTYGLFNKGRPVPISTRQSIYATHQIFGQRNGGFDFHS